MAVLIKEMAMPNGCMDCYFSDFDHTDVLVCDFNPGNDIEDVHTRPSWCPLVEVPKAISPMTKEELEDAGFEI